MPFKLTFGLQMHFMHRTGEKEKRFSSFTETGKCMLCTDTTSFFLFFFFFYLYRQHVFLGSFPNLFSTCACLWAGMELTGDFKWSGIILEQELSELNLIPGSAVCGQTESVLNQRPHDTWLHSPLEEDQRGVLRPGSSLRCPNFRCWFHDRAITHNTTTPICCATFKL